jgi:hypothetical protein
MDTTLVKGNIQVDAAPVEAQKTQSIFFDAQSSPSLQMVAKSQQIAELFNLCSTLPALRDAIYSQLKPCGNCTMMHVLTPRAPA